MHARLPRLHVCSRLAPHLHHHDFRSPLAKGKGNSYQQMHDSGPSKYLASFKDHRVAGQRYVKVSNRESKVAEGAPEGEAARETIQAL